MQRNCSGFSRVRSNSAKASAGGRKNHRFEPGLDFPRHNLLPRIVLLSVDVYKVTTTADSGPGSYRVESALAAADNTDPTLDLTAMGGKMIEVGDLGQTVFPYNVNIVCPPTGSPVILDAGGNECGWRFDGPGTSNVSGVVTYENSTGLGYTSSVIEVAGATTSLVVGAGLTGYDCQNDDYVGPGCSESITGAVFQGTEFPSQYAIDASTAAVSLTVLNSHVYQKAYVPNDYGAIVAAATYIDISGNNFGSGDSTGSAPVVSLVENGTPGATATFTYNFIAANTAVAALQVTDGQAVLNGEAQTGVVYADQNIAINNTGNGFEVDGSQFTAASNIVRNNGGTGVVFKPSVSGDSFTGTYFDVTGNAKGGLSFPGPATQTVPTLSLSEVGGNTTGGNGAGIYVNTILSTWENTINGNSAKGYGGAIYVGLLGNLTTFDDLIGANSAVAGANNIDGAQGQTNCSYDFDSQQSAQYDGDITFGPGCIVAIAPNLYSPQLYQGAYSVICNDEWGNTPIQYVLGSTSLASVNNPGSSKYWGTTDAGGNPITPTSDFIGSMSVLASAAPAYEVLNLNASGSGSLSAEVTLANAAATQTGSPQLVVFNPGQSGTVSPSATIQVAPGVTIAGLSSLGSNGLPAPAITVSGQNVSSGPLFEMTAGASSTTSVVENLIITGVSATGVGVQLDANATGSLVNDQLTGNAGVSTESLAGSTLGINGGTYTENTNTCVNAAGALTLTNTELDYNYANAGEGVVEASSNAYLDNNTVQNNYSDVPALYFSPASAGAIDDIEQTNVFANQPVLHQNIGGGAFKLYSPTYAVEFIVRNSTIAANGSANDCYGGGVDVEAGQNVAVTGFILSNTFLQNSGQYGGAVFVGITAGDVQLGNNVTWADYGQQEFCDTLNANNSGYVGLISLGYNSIPEIYTNPLYCNMGYQSTDLIGTPAYNFDNPHLDNGGYYGGLPGTISFAPSPQSYLVNGVGPNLNNWPNPVDTNVSNSANGNVDQFGVTRPANANSRGAQMTIVGGVNTFVQRNGQSGSGSAGSKAKRVVSLRTGVSVSATAGSASNLLLGTLPTLDPTAVDQVLGSDKTLASASSLRSPRHGIARS